MKNLPQGRCGECGGWYKVENGVLCLHIVVFKQREVCGGSLQPPVEREEP